MKICCHSQHCERWVGLTSQAALQVIGQEKRHQWLIVKAKNEIPVNFKKSDWKDAAKN